MAYPTGVAYRVEGPVAGLRPIAETSTTQWHPLGTKAVGVDYTYGPATFLYLLGVASTAPGDFVCYDTKTGVTVRAVAGGATSTGPGAVAMSDNVAGQYGWYCVEGSVPVAAATVADDAPLYLTATAGTLDDAVIAGAKVSGIVSRAATASGFATCQLNYPEVSSESTIASVATSLLKITLTAAAEFSQSITVSGAVTDMAGTPVASKQVLFKSLVKSSGEGGLTVLTGTEQKTLAGNFESSSWLTTTAGGLFSMAVDNSLAETTLVHAYTETGASALLKLTFT